MNRYIIEWVDTRVVSVWAESEEEAEFIFDNEGVGWGDLVTCDIVSITLDETGGDDDPCRKPR